ncbi:hypothetical protein GCM10010517_25410 [Streptosporangium fragile]|uniref:DUF35 domain-containing protein n=1 Tax=Streptosporangium fragile TaxID=46186 RepID=A0ABN3VY61_9ACTN
MAARLMSAQVTGRRGNEGEAVRLHSGEVTTFGACSCRECGFDLRLPCQTCDAAVAGALPDV